MTIYDIDRSSRPSPQSDTAPLAKGTRRRAARTRSAGASIVARALLLAMAYVLVTLGLLTGLLVELREEAIGAARRELSAFAQLATGHTSEVAFDLEQRLRLAAVTLSVASTAGAPDQEQVAPMLREVVSGSRALKDIVVLDPRGRAIYQASGSAGIGLDWSDRPAFARLSGSSAPEFRLAEPLRDTGLIPVMLPWRRSNGEFLGVVVGLMDPRYFDAVWAFDSEIEGLSIGLVSGDVLIARLPAVASLAGAPSIDPGIAARLAGSRVADAVEAINPLTGRLDLQAFRQIVAYPGLAMVVTQPMDIVLAGWRQIAWISGSCWVLASAALAALGLWLAHETRAREALRRRYHALFNSIPQAVVVSDRETGTILACNDAAIERYGWPAPETESAAGIALPPDFAVLRDPELAVSRDIGRLFENQRHRNAQGETIDVELTVRQIDVDDRPALLTVAADVSDRVGAERQRRAAEEQLRHSQKMDTLGQLTGGIAHDFNNVLMVVADGVEELGERSDLPAGMRGVLDRIAEAANRAEELTRKMLAFSRKQPLKPRPVNLNDLVADTGNLMRRVLGEHIEIDSILADELWMVEIDPALFETSLVNLCLNARDAMAAGGRVMVETANVTVGRADSRRELPMGDYVLVTVSDTGQGIPAQHLDRIFEPYFTTKTGSPGSGPGGSGLGLSMIYGFVRQSGGHIAVESEVDRGTAFRIHLPRHFGAAAAAHAPELSTVPGGSEHVLVVEDDAAVRASVVRQLTSLGYSVGEADSGAAGLQVFEAAPRPFDLLLTDVIMPGVMNGKALAGEVARRWPRTAILFMSGYSASILGDADASLPLLAKPFRKADLARVVRHALDAQRRRGPEDSL